MDRRGLPFHIQQEKVLISSWAIPLYLNLNSNNCLPGQSCVSRQHWRTFKWICSVSGDTIGILGRQLTKNSQQICYPHSKTKKMLSPQKSAIRKKLVGIFWCEFYADEIWQAAKFIQRTCLKTDLIHYTSLICNWIGSFILLVGLLVSGAFIVI